MENNTEDQAVDAFADIKDAYEFGRIDAYI